MLDQNYYVSAQWDENWWWYPPDNPDQAQPYPLGDWSAGYNVSPSGEISGGGWMGSSDGSPVALTAEGASPLVNNPLGASANISRFSVQNSAHADPGNVFYPAPIGGNAFYAGTIQTVVQADWLFSPMGSVLEVGVNDSFYDRYGSDYGGLAATLIDTTTGHALLNIVNSSLSANYTFAVHPQDVYELNVSGWSDTFDSDDAVESFTATIVSVSEPGTCVLLLLGSLLLVRFRNGSGTGHHFRKVRPPAQMDPHLKSGILDLPARMKTVV